MFAQHFSVEFNRRILLKNVRKIQGFLSPPQTPRQLCGIGIPLRQKNPSPKQRQGIFYNQRRLLCVVLNGLRLSGFTRKKHHYNRSNRWQYPAHTNIK